MGDVLFLFCEPCQMSRRPKQLAMDFLLFVPQWILTRCLLPPGSKRDRRGTHKRKTTPHPPSLKDNDPSCPTTTTTTPQHHHPLHPSSTPTPQHCISKPVSQPVSVPGPSSAPLSNADGVPIAAAVADDVRTNVRMY